MIEWATVDDLKARLAPPFTAADEALIVQSVAAANGFIETFCPWLAEADPARMPYQRWGAQLLAKEQYDRLGKAQTPAFSEFGFTPATIQNRDIEAALGLGYHHDPVIA